jgi:hypothetical protein
MFSVPGCGMPISLTGSKDSFRKVNYGLQQAISSLNIICDNLNRSEDYWWTKGSKSADLKDVVMDARQALGVDDENRNPSAAAAAAAAASKQQEPIDLQAGRKKKPLAYDTDLDDDDDDDDDEEDGNAGSEFSG